MEGKNVMRDPFRVKNKREKNRKKKRSPRLRLKRNPINNSRREVDLKDIFLPAAMENRGGREREQHSSSLRTQKELS